LAGFRDHYPETRAAGASVVAVSVDTPQESEFLRISLSSSFPVLCDTERRVVRDWGIYNSEERGGIAKPAVFIIESRYLIRYASTDTVVMRVPAVEVVALLQNAHRAQTVRRRVHIPLMSDWISAIRNNFRPH